MKVLLVDDEENFRQIIISAFEKEGINIVVGKNGREGLDKAKEEKPDLILLDLVLPKKTGFAVLEKLKADPNTMKIPVIILSNLESINDINKALELGGTTYLLKANYRLDEVVEKIKEVLESL